MQLHVVVDISHEQDRFFRAISLLDPDRADPGDIHVERFARSVVGEERGSIRAVWRDGKAETVNHVLRAFLALLRIAMIPLDVNAWHSRGFAGFRLTKPYPPAPVEQVGTLVASPR